MRTKRRSSLEPARRRPVSRPARAARLRSRESVLEAPSRREEATSRPRVERIAYLDRLKLLMVAVIIAGHGAMGYSGFADTNAWPYQDVREVKLGAVSDLVLSSLAIPPIRCVMGMFFLISGMVTPRSLSRRGPRSFARDRLIRLGVPLAVWALVVWPGAKWAVHLAAGQTQSFWWRFMHDKPFLDTGPMWFVEVLLVYSLAYAAWRYWRQRRAPGPDAGAGSIRGTALSGRTLVWLAVAISVLTVLVRPVFPVASGQVGQLHLWQQPQFVAMFALGIVAARHDWLDPVPDRIRRRCGFAALGAIAVFLLVVAIITATGMNGDVIYDRGFHWLSLSAAALEGPLAVGACVWLLGTAQRRLDRPLGPLAQAMSRSAYGAFLLQGVVLTGLMIALRPIGVPAEIKALTVASLGVVGSFTLAWVLVTRTWVGRVL